MNLTVFDKNMIIDWRIT